MPHLAFWAWLLGLIAGVFLCLIVHEARAQNWGIDNSYESAPASSGMGVGTVSGAHLPPTSQPVLAMNPPPVTATLPPPFTGLEAPLFEPDNDDAQDLAAVNALCAMSVNLEACGGLGSIEFYETIELGGHGFN